MYMLRTWMAMPMTFEMKLDQRYEEGQQAGIESVAINMLQENHSVEEIKKCTGLTVERIMELAELQSV